VFTPRSDWYEALPSSDAIDRLEGAELEHWQDAPPAERVGLGWSLLVSDREQEIWERARDVPGFRWSAVGLLDAEVDHALTEDEPPFGVILYADDDQGESGEARAALDFGEIQLPVVVRYGSYEEQQSLGHGRHASWATSRHGRRSGWLTARHVADHPLMPKVGTVVDRAPECLDAALVDVGMRGGGSVQHLATPAVGATVEIDLATPQRATIIDVATNLSVGRSSRFPLRFSLNVAGVAGESGSLIASSSSADPMGLYLGAFTSNQGARGGIGLALTQIKYFMDLEVYA
jgi:hypothetical protein